MLLFIVVGALLVMQWLAESHRASKNPTDVQARKSDDLVEQLVPSNEARDFSSSCGSYSLFCVSHLLHLFSFIISFLLCFYKPCLSTWLLLPFFRYLGLWKNYFINQTISSFALSGFSELTPSSAPDNFVANSSTIFTPNSQLLRWA